MKKDLEKFTPQPDDAALFGDLARMAEVIEHVAPGRGREIVVAICREFGGSGVYFLQEEKLFREARDNWIRAMYDLGHRAQALVRATGVSERNIWYILGREPGEDRQMRLF